ncbi:ABC transporter substrate-binding protein [Klebsiella pneumoniae]|nr:ABC transporter substrate-binding protein [Klebsiella pneumoniae]
MRLSFSGRVAAALMLLALGGYATAQERLTLRIADQKGGMRSQLEAANALQNLPYDIKWAEFPAAAPLAEALNAGAVDAGIIGDAPLLFALANGAPVKAIAVDKSNPAGTAVLVSPGSTLKSGADLKGKRIATGKGSIGHFVALKALEQAGISPKEVQWVFLGPVDAKVALLNGSVDAWATWEPYTTQMVKTNEGQILLTAKDSPFGGLESLKGQTIGVTDMAGPDKNFFAILLKRHGIDPISDVQWKVYPADLLSVALDKREIAAISGSEPFSYRLLETGKYQLIASNMTGDYANLSCCVLGVSGRLARDHKPAAAALTQAILEAHSYAAAHPESVAQFFLAHALNTSEAEVSGILHGQGHGHHAVGEAFVKELTQYAVDLQRVQVIKPGTDPHHFAERIYANVFA